MISLPISGSSFWSTLATRLESSSGVVACQDGDIKYAALSAKRSMHIIHRTAEELFTTTVTRESMNHGYKVVINGNFYDISAYMDVLWGP